MSSTRIWTIRLAKFALYKDDWCVGVRGTGSASSETFLLDAHKEKTIRKPVFLETWGLFHFPLDRWCSFTQEYICCLSLSCMLQFLGHFECFSVYTFCLFWWGFVVVWFFLGFLVCFFFKSMLYGILTVYHTINNLFLSAYNFYIIHPKCW